jgi:hypothetical protein
MSKEMTDYIKQILVFMCNLNKLTSNIGDTLDPYSIIIN